MTTLPFTARVSKSGSGFVLWVPKAITTGLKLGNKSLVVLQIKKSNLSLPFTARVSKSGRGYVLWIPKAISTGLKFKDKDLVVIEITKVAEGKR